MTNKHLHAFLPNIKKVPNCKLYVLDTYYSAIISNETYYLTKTQIEVCKRIISRILKKKKKNFIPFVRYTYYKTKKPIGSRMGKGKGSVSENVALIRSNEIIFRFRNIPLLVLKGLVTKISSKLPVSISWRTF